MIQLDNIKAIYFDLDNTLIDRNTAFKKCINDYFHRFLPDLSCNEVWPLIEQKDNWGYTQRTKFSQWFINFFSPQNQTVIDFLEFQRLSISTYILPLESFILQQLKTLKSIYQMGILTNGGYYNQYQKIKNSKLDQLFSDKEILISEKYQIKKPNPQIFQLLLNKLEIAPNQLLYVGDDPLNDIWGAQQLGIKTAWISWGRTWKKNFQTDYSTNNFHTILNKLCHTI